MRNRIYRELNNLAFGQWVSINQTMVKKLRLADGFVYFVLGDDESADFYTRETAADILAS